MTKQIIDCKTLDDVIALLVPESHNCDSWWIEAKEHTTPYKNATLALMAEELAVHMADAPNRIAKTDEAFSKLYLDWWNKKNDLIKQYNHIKKLIREAE